MVVLLLLLKGSMAVQVVVKWSRVLAFNSDDLGSTPAELPRNLGPLVKSS